MACVILERTLHKVQHQSLKEEIAASLELVPQEIKVNTIRIEDGPKHMTLIYVLKPSISDERFGMALGQALDVLGIPQDVIKI